MDVKHLIGYLHQVKCGFEPNELVSLALEASCSTAYIPVPCLEMVVTVPYLLDSTLDGWHRWFDVYIMYFFYH